MTTDSETPICLEADFRFRSHPLVLQSKSKPLFLSDDDDVYYYYHYYYYHTLYNCISDAICSRSSVDSNVSPTNKQIFIKSVWMGVQQTEKTRDNSTTACPGVGAGKVC